MISASQRCSAVVSVGSEIRLTLGQRLALSLRPRRGGRHVDDASVEPLVDRYTHLTQRFSHTLVAVVRVFGGWIVALARLVRRGIVVSVLWCARSARAVSAAGLCGLWSQCKRFVTWTVLRFHNRKPVQWRAMLWPAIMLLLLVGIGVVAVAPTRTYITQQRQIEETLKQREAIVAENELLQQQADRLTTPEEVERLARSEYGLVRKGEQPYAILPGTNSVTDTYGAVDPDLVVEPSESKSTISTIVDFVTFWS